MSDQQNELEKRFGGAAAGPARFPPGEEILPSTPYVRELLAEVDSLLLRGECADGRFELQTPASRLVCLIHRSAPYLAGLIDGEHFTRVPLADFVARAGQLASPVCRLVRSATAEVLMIAVHFCQRPSLQGSTELVDPEHVLRFLAKEKQDAAIALERDGRRTLLFLDKGRPAHLFFADPADDPGGADLEERVLLFAFAATAAACRIEVFTRLNIEADPDAGASLLRLEAAAQPPPPADVVVTMADGREVRRRPFSAPEMIVGRDPTVDLFIDNLAVSRKHARLFWDRGSFAVEDLDSANGTRVGGREIDRHRLGAGETIEIGKFEVGIVEYEAAPTVFQTMLMTSSGRPAPVAVLSGEGVRKVLDRDLLIGKGDGVDVRARGLFVRPVHARVSVAGDGGFRVSCLAGGSVRVNGRKLRDSELTFGDRVLVGRTLFRLDRPKPGTPG